MTVRRLESAIRVCVTGASGSSRAAHLRSAQELVDRAAAERRPARLLRRRLAVGRPVSRRAADMAALVERIRLLSGVLSAIASDLVDARREIRQLRRENARLKQRLTRSPVVPTGRP
jgi:chromosome segregation ATPase